MPRVTTGNTMAACVIIGERAGKLLRTAPRCQEPAYSNQGHSQRQTVPCPRDGATMAPSLLSARRTGEMLKKDDTIMNSLMEIEKERETKLRSAKIEDGFYNIIGGQRSTATSKLSVLNPATRKKRQLFQISSLLHWTTR
jgi:hypothetical protein